MKAYKVTGYIIDHEQWGEDQLRDILYNQTVFLNDMKFQEAEIGEWGDDHELNKRGCDYEKYFLTNQTEKGRV